MRRRPPRSTRTDTLFPYTTLFRSASVFRAPHQSGDEDRLLVREKPEEIRLLDADPLGDRSGGGAAVAGDRELGDRRANDVLTPFLRDRKSTRLNSSH